MNNKIHEKVKNLPSDWWQNAWAASGLVEWFKFHVIGLLIAGRTNNLMQYEVFSGFLFEQNNRLLWITAGHAVDKVKAILDSVNFTISFMTWLDWYDVPGAEGVLVHDPNLRMKSWKPTGLDLGIIEIHGLDKENILANEAVRPVEETIWKNLAAARMEGYYVIGFPRAWTSLTSEHIVTGKPRHSVTAKIACLPIVELPFKSEAAHPEFWQDPSDFHGRIVPYRDMPEIEVEDIRGMSGGPILSVERTEDGQILYRLLGVVKIQVKSRNLIKAVPIEKITPLIRKWDYSQRLNPRD
jgi:hypothetical protein